MGNIANAIFFGSAAEVGEDIQAVFILGTDPAELQAQMDAAILEITAGRGRNIIDISLGGGGKGNVFLITLTTGEAGAGPAAAYPILFGGSSEDELTNAAAAAKAAVLALEPDATFVGQTIVGGAHGAPFCGMIIGGAP